MAIVSNDLIVIGYCFQIFDAVTEKLVFANIEHSYRTKRFVWKRPIYESVGISKMQISQCSNWRQPKSNDALTQFSNSGNNRCTYRCL